MTAATWVVVIAVTGCATVPTASPTTLHFDYAGAETLIGALDESSFTTDQLTRLQSTHGLMAMVDNVARYVPDATRVKFESDLCTS